MSLHINNNYAKKRGIGKKLPLTIRAVMLDEHVDLVAGDFNGATSRRQTGDCNLSIIEEAFADSDLPMPPGPTPLWDPGAVPGGWADVCGFLDLRTLMNDGKYVSMVHSPFSMTLWAYVERINVDIMKCGYTWLSLTIMVTTNRVKGMSNGFSSKKDLLPTNPAKKDAGQVRTKATVRFRPKRQATVRYRLNRPYVQHEGYTTRFTKAIVL